MHYVKISVARVQTRARVARVPRERTRGAEGWKMQPSSQEILFAGKIFNGAFINNSRCGENNNVMRNIKEYGSLDKHRKFFYISHYVKISVARVPRERTRGAGG